jgi:hypothetical protein
MADAAALALPLNFYAEDQIKDPASREFLSPPY